jgi:hypothetical protein
MLLSQLLPTSNPIVFQHRPMESTRNKSVRHRGIQHRKMGPIAVAIGLGKIGNPGALHGFILIRARNILTPWKYRYFTNRRKR